MKNVHIRSQLRQRCQNERYSTKLALRSRCSPLGTTRLAALPRPFTGSFDTKKFESSFKGQLTAVKHFGFLQPAQVEAHLKEVTLGYILCRYMYDDEMAVIFYIHGRRIFQLIDLYISCTYYTEVRPLRNNSNPVPFRNWSLFSSILLHVHREIR
jgi:hypothetical protein